MKKIYLKRGKEESLLRFHPWVFSGAIQQADEDLKDGDLVRVLTNHGDFIAVGHFQMGSSEYSRSVMSQLMLISGHRALLLH